MCQTNDNNNNNNNDADDDDNKHQQQHNNNNRRYWSGRTTRTAPLIHATARLSASADLALSLRGKSAVLTNVLLRSVCLSVSRLYVSVCVSACVYARVTMCVCAHVCVYVSACVCVCALARRPSEGWL